MNKVDILISTKDRATEMYGLMQSLRTQTFKNWDLYIADNASGTQLTQFHFINSIVNRLRIEGHKIKIIRNNIDFGICYVRNMLNKIQIEEGDGNYTLRIDDDILIENDYITKLFDVIDKGYDIASGITPLLTNPEWKREIKFLKGIINRIEIDDKGNLIIFGDDCGYGYIENEIIAAHHFRSSALYKSEINNIKYPDNLSRYGFREESFFSLKALMKGYRIGVHTAAKAFHLQTLSGGGRLYATQDCIQSDDLIFREWVKKNKEELIKCLNGYKG